MCVCVCVQVCRWVGVWVGMCADVCVLMCLSECVCVCVIICSYLRICCPFTSTHIFYIVIFSSVCLFLSVLCMCPTWDTIFLHKIIMFCIACRCWSFENQFVSAYAVLTLMTFLATFDISSSAFLQSRSKSRLPMRYTSTFQQSNCFTKPHWKKNKTKN